MGAGKKQRIFRNALFLVFCSVGCAMIGHWMQAQQGSSSMTARKQPQRRLAARSGGASRSRTLEEMDASALSSQNAPRKLLAHLQEAVTASSAEETPTESASASHASTKTSKEVTEEEPTKGTETEHEATEAEKEESEKEEKEEEEEEEKEEELKDESVFEAVDLEVVVVIALFLILATLGFEAMKEGLEESVTEDMEVILEKLFGELTILGFLAMVTFLLTQTGILEILSIKVFGDGKSEELLEYFEDVHFSIFFIMVFFVFQVLIMIREATETERFWVEMDALAKTDASRRQLSINTNCKSTRDAFQQEDSIWAHFFPVLINHKAEHKRMVTIFKALREEFILERALDEPFSPAPMDRRVDPDFNFGRYLSLAQAFTLTRIVEVEEKTWALFAVGVIIFFFICQAVGRDIEIISWIFVGIAWITFIFNLLFERHLIAVRNKFIPKKYLMQNAAGGSTLLNDDDSQEDFAAEETTYLVKTFEGPNSAHLPAWCDVDIEAFRKKRNIIVSWLIGGTPNRQQALFWMDAFGPKLYFILLQSNLIFTGVYVGMALLTFVPYLYKIYWWPLLTAYCVLASLPVVGISYNKKRVLAALAQVSSIGAYRKPQIVSDVLLETKTGRVVRTFLIIHKMWHTARHGMEKSDEHDKPKNSARRADSFSALERLEVSKSFDALDTDGGGSISHDEFRDLLVRLGCEVSEEGFTAMVNTLDVDGDGEVTKEEFMAWYASQSSADEMTLQERAHDLYMMFDRDGSGEITIGEFKHKLDALRMGFSVDEIGAIVNELDRDRNGTVEEHEFYHLLRKYYPKELTLLEAEEDHDGSAHGNIGSSSSHHGGESARSSSKHK